MSSCVNLFVLLNVVYGITWSDSNAKIEIIWHFMGVLGSVIRLGGAFLFLPNYAACAYKKINSVLFALTLIYSQSFSRTCHQDNL